ncbi:MAG: hypothetical protein AB7F25_12030 [Deferribacterales bacterium]
MKKYIAAVIFAALMTGCGAQTASVAPADQTRLEALEIQQKSDSERIARLEKELSETKEALERSQRQSKQLGESYDTLVGMFRDYKQVVVGLMDNMKKMMNSTAKDKEEAPKGN